MRFLRWSRSGSERFAVGAPEGPTAAPDGNRTGPEPASEDERAAALAGEFDAGLTDLARRQLRFAGYAWEPPAELDPRGRWVVAEAVEATGGDGRPVALAIGETLELDEGQGTSGSDPDRTAWPFVRSKDGRRLHLDAGPHGSFPDALARPDVGPEGPG
jgi:hypothetical protein